MVGMSMSQHHPLNPTKPLPCRPRRLPHPLRPGIELHNPIPVLKEVHVHSPPKIPAKQPHPIGNLLLHKSQSMAESFP